MTTHKTRTLNTLIAERLAELEGEIAAVRALATLQGTPLPRRRYRRRQKAIASPVTPVATETATPPKKRTMSAEARKAVSIRMKRYHAKKRKANGKKHSGKKHDAVFTI